MPTPPAGRGAALQHFAVTHTSQYRNAALMVVVVYVLMGITTGDFLWFRDMWWFLAIVIAAAVVYLVLIPRNEVLFAGSDWLQHRKKWIDTYNVTDIRLPGGPNGERTIVLTDHNDTKVTIDLTFLQANRGLWDLVYNGLAHSVADGAKIHGVTSDMVLKLDRYRQSESA